MQKFETVQKVHTNDAIGSFAINSKNENIKFRIGQYVERNPFKIGMNNR